MRITAVRVAVGVLGLTVVGMVAAVSLDLPAQFVVGEPATTIGIEALWAGSAVNASWVAVAGVGIGALLAAREGFARSLGLGLLAAMGSLVTVGWLGEYASGPPFTGIDLAVFVALSIVGLAFSALLVGTAIRELFGTSGPLPVARVPRFQGDEPTARGR